MALCNLSVQPLIYFLREPRKRKPSSRIRGDIVFIQQTGIICCADHADNGSVDGADWPGTVIVLNNAYTVVIFLWHRNSLYWDFLWCHWCGFVLCCRCCRRREYNNQSWHCGHKKGSRRSLFSINESDRLSDNLTRLFGFFLSQQETLKHCILLRFDSGIVNLSVFLRCLFV